MEYGFEDLEGFFCEISFVVLLRKLGIETYDKGGNSFNYDWGFAL
jgi:hypothetical protein